MDTFMKSILLVLCAMLNQSCAQGNESLGELYFHDSKKGLVKMSASGGKHILVSSKIGDSFAYDPVRSYFYWSVPINQSSIGRFSLITNTTEFMLVNFEPRFITVDYISNLLYVTSGRDFSIRIINFDVRSTKVLPLGRYKTHAMAVDPENGWMYRSFENYPLASYGIEKVRMDGTSQHVIYSLGGFIDNLVLDKPERKLFFSELNGSVESVNSINVDGSGKQNHFYSSGIYVRGLAVDQHFIYLITNWNFSRINKTNYYGQGLNPEKLGEEYPTSNSVNLVLIDSYNQQPGTNACSENNGGCRHYCLAIPGGRSCACPGPMRLDGLECVNECGDDQWVYSEEIKLCYTLQSEYHQGYTWHEARIRCKALDSDLATPSTAAQNDFLSKLTVDDEPGFHYAQFIGLWHENGASGQDTKQRREDWKWVDGSPYQFHAWNPDHPLEGTRYARMTFQGEWVGIPRKSSEFFFCQKDPTSRGVISPAHPDGITAKPTLAFLALLVIPVIVALVLSVICFKRKQSKNEESGQQYAQYDDIDELNMNASQPSPAGDYYSEARDGPVLKKSQQGAAVSPNDVVIPPNGINNLEGCSSFAGVSEDVPKYLKFKKSTIAPLQPSSTDENDGYELPVSEKVGQLGLPASPNDTAIPPNGIDNLAGYSSCADEDVSKNLKLKGSTIDSLQPSSTNGNNGYELLVSKKGSQLGLPDPPNGVDNFEGCSPNSEVSSDLSTYMKLNSGTK